MRPSLSRRELLFGGASLCCMSALRAGQRDAPATTIEIAPGVHVRRGVHELSTASNADAIANLGFVIGSDCVAVIDPGGSLQDGERLRARIRELTERPIRYVLMTHVHPDHIFGAGAFVRDAPQFIGHRELQPALAQRGEYYREQLTEVLGPNAVGPIVQPTQLVHDRIRLELGGRALLIEAHPIAHTNNDLTVIDEGSGTLFASDLLFVERAPSLDGSIKGWLKVLAALTELGVSRTVPGHGPAQVELMGAASKLREYLDTVLTQTRAAIAAGVDIGVAPAHIAQAERSKWQLFDEYHGQNVTQAYRELEWE